MDQTVRGTARTLAVRALDLHLELLLASGIALLLLINGAGSG